MVRRAECDEERKGRDKEEETRAKVDDVSAFAGYIFGSTSTPREQHGLQEQRWHS